MRAIWKGSISFSLVNVPIALYPATRSKELNFRLLRKSDLSPVNYKRVAEADGKEVPWEDIVKGYEYEKGKFVVLRDEDFRRVDIEATQTVDIIDFVELNEIDPMFFDKPYYLEPQKSGTKAYVLLREGLRKSGKVGIAKVVIKTRQHLAAVKPMNDALVLELMHFADELLKPDTLKIPGELKIGTKELDMALSLIDKMTSKWDPNKYQDDYRAALRNLIQENIEHGGEAPTVGQSKQKRPGNIIDLASVLQESLDRINRGGAKHKASAVKAKRRPKLKKAA